MSKPTKPESAPVTVWDALAEKYSLPYHILLWEVRNATGFKATRALDAIAVGLYVSRGQFINGFEIKHSRADWLTELKHPEKAETIAKFCDYFFLVTADEKIAKLEEIPELWGWMVLRGSLLKVLKKAEKLPAIPLDRQMLCAILYAAKEKYLAAGVKSMDEEVARRVKAEHSHITMRAENAERREGHLNEIMDRFEKASGLYIRYQEERIPQMGDAVRRLMRESNVFADYKEDLEYLVKRAEGIAADLRKEISEIKEMKPASDTGSPVESRQTQ